MILVLSRTRNEVTTEFVIDWLENLGADFLRLNAEDLEYPSKFLLKESLLQLSDDRDRGVGTSIPLNEVRTVWYRRWTLFKQYHLAHVEEFSEDPFLQYEVTRYLGRELEAVGLALFASLQHAQWLSDPASAKVGKVRVLAAARDAGLAVPDTLIATTREALDDARRAHGRIITKSIGHTPLSLHLSESGLAAYTTEVEEGILKDIAEPFFPSLVQEFIEKRYELRVFFLEDRFYPMAIFSQSDPQTEMDFRHYNDAKPNRYVPYTIPEALEDQLRTLTRSLGLNTGSIDMIRAVDGRFVFLEVNPVGQFSMVSIPCNYYLEKKVAQHLMRHDR